VTDKQENM